MFGHETWSNASTMPTVSPLEVIGSEAITTSRYGKLDRPQTFRTSRLSTGADQIFNATRTQGPMTVMSPLTVSLPTSSSSLHVSSDLSRSVDSDDDIVIAHYMYNMAADFRNIMSAHVGGNATERCNGFDVDSGKASSSSNTSTKLTSVPSNVSMAMIDFPHGSIMFLNTTAPNYLLIDHANATVVVWTEPANDSMTATETKSRQILDRINAVLPWIEACGLLAIVWEIGKFVHARVYACRRRSRRVSAAEESQ